MALCTCEGSKFHTGERIVIAEALPTALRRMLSEHATARGLVVDRRLGGFTRAFIVSTTRRYPSDEESRAREAGVAILGATDLQRMLRDLCGENNNPGWIVDTEAIARGRESAAAVAKVARLDLEQPDSSPPNSLSRPRRPLTLRPLTRDPLFWLVLLAWACLGSWQAFHLNFVGFLSSLLATFLLLGLAPAAGRRMALAREDRKACEIQPADLVPGWKPDPTSASIWRWWNGMSWTHALHPAPRRWVGWLTIAIGVLLISVWLVAADTGRTTAATGPSPLPFGRLAASPPANPGELVARSLTDLESGLLRYGNVKAEELAASVVFASIDSSYSAMSKDLALITSADQLPPGSPSLSLLQQFVEAMGPYVQVRRSFYAAQESCRTQPQGSEQTSCLTKASARWEEPMLATISAVVTAYTRLNIPR